MEKPHPIIVLIGVMIVGIFVWPWMKRAGHVDPKQVSDFAAAAVLILFYLAYRTWYEKTGGSGRKK